MLTRSLPWTEQPQYETGLDLSHPLAQGLTHAHSGLASLQGWTAVNGPSPVAIAGGAIAWRFTSASSQYVRAAAGRANGYPLTMFAYVRQSAAGSNRSIMGVGGAANNRHILYVTSTNNVAAFSGDSGGNNGQAVTTSNAYTSTSAWYAFGARFTSATSRDVWADGVSVASNTSSSSPSSL